jgi:hypothetical protein
MFSVACADSVFMRRWLFSSGRGNRGLQDFGRCCMGCTAVSCCVESRVFRMQRTHRGYKDDRYVECEVLRYSCLRRFVVHETVFVQQQR